MKKNICLSILACAVLLLAACGAATDYKNAAVVGYETPFNKQLEAFAKEEISKSEDVLSYDIAWTDGWTGKLAPPETELAGNEKAVSCTLTLQMKGETNHLIFYFSYLNRMLSPEAVAMEEADTWYQLDAEEWIEGIYNGSM